jgi:hypothetical protein
MEDKTSMLLEQLIEYMKAHEAAMAKLKAKIEEIFSHSEWDPAKIRWEKAEGKKGEYERSEDINNPEFKALLKDLASHGGKLTRDGIFYWTFRNGSTVGRKRGEQREGWKDADFEMGKNR